MQTDPTDRDTKTKLSPHEQFAQDYAASVGRTVEDLVEDGMVVTPCGCQGPTCRGWLLMWSTAGKLVHDVPTRTAVAS